MRALIIGSPGSGKSTFARALAQCVDIPAVHLDRIYHDPEAGYLENKPAFRSHVDSLLAEPRWIMDGHYPSTLTKRLDAADTVFFLDYSLPVALLGAVRRRLRSGRNLRDDMPDDWRERVSLSLLRQIAVFRRVERPRVIFELAQRPWLEVVCFRAREDATQ